MINLLPPQLKQDLFYARRNTVLLWWLVGVLVGCAGCVVVITGGMLFLNRAQVSYTSLVNDTNQQIKDQKLDQVQSQVDSISSNLGLVVKVLGREVLFSQLLDQIGAALPQGAVLTGLNITQIEGGLDLQAATVDYQTATQMQVNLQDPANKIFSKADIVSIQCQTSGGSSFSASYPCNVDIRAQFATNNPFLFINNTSSSGTKT